MGWSTPISSTWLYLTCWVLGSCFVPFPGNLCQSDFPDTAVVDKAKDEKYNGQNKATDLKRKEKTQLIHFI